MIRNILLLSLVTMVAGCTTIELAKSVAQSIYKHSSKHKQTGYYKVGNPYKIAGTWYYPEVDTAYEETGIASWYGDAFDGKLTSNGEVFDKTTISAAHKTLPLPSIVRITNLENQKSMLVRINDRGPYAGDRIIDLSEATAKKLGLYMQGTGKVRVEFDNAATNRMFAHASHAHYSRPAEHAAEGVAQRIIKKRSGGGLFVQTGAYSSQENARKVVSALNDITRVVIQEVRVRNETIFRVRLGPFETESAADDAVSQAINIGYTDAIIVTN